MNDSHRTPWRRALGALAVLLVAFAATGCGKRPERAVKVEAPRPYAWSKDVLQVAAEIPVQHAGRVKPLSTAAGFSLLKLNGKRKYRIPEESGLPTGGERLDPTGWLLDVLFFPEQASHYEVFLVEESAVLEGVGLHFPDRKRRDRYSYAQLEPARPKIFEAARAAHNKDEKRRSSVERQSLDLWQRIVEFESLRSTLDYSRIPVPADLPPSLRAALGDALVDGRVSATAYLLGREKLLPTLEALRAGSDAEREGLERFESAMAMGLDFVTRDTQGALCFLAPEVAKQTKDGMGRDAWDAPGDVLAGVAQGAEPRQRQLAVLGSMAAALQERADPTAFAGRLAEAQRGARGLAEARGEYQRIGLERTYYRIDFFYNALAIFLLAFLFAATSWITPGVRWLPRAVTWTTALGCALVVAGVAVRCVLRQRPPVVSLYDTILFITGTGVFVALLLSRIMKMPLAASLGAFMGAVGMFMANRYELREATTSGDTMGVVQAVLDTNFWLATHVTTVTLGYSAGLLACLLAHLWLGGRMLGFRANDPRWHRQLGRAVYGIIAFGLLFSTVGTILGGVWANDSWGRFWGWDPKENGALMICLFELAIVHARLGGYIKDFGVAVSAIVLGPVVAFSWWHVNLLGVGLHSYGFTAGIKEKLFAFYAFELAFAAAALAWWALRGRHLLGHRPQPPDRPAAATGEGAILSR